MIKNGEVSLIINTPSGQSPREDEVKICSTAVANRIPVLTNLRAAEASIQAPEVIAVKLRVARAVTTREKALASGEFRRVMRAAMEAADPRVKELFARRDRDARPRLAPGTRTDRRRSDDK